MPLNKSQLESAIKAVLTQEKNKRDDGSTSIDNISQKLATAIDTYVKSATVTVNVTTTGSASAQAGTGTGTLT
ncbi:MAG: hypothetical protein QM535_03320 [Limnohabitans sp.]|nr:hypothetical protein [Limnohabitans sp.]